MTRCDDVIERGRLNYPSSSFSDTVDDSVRSPLLSQFHGMGMGGGGGSERGVGTVTLSPPRTRAEGGV